MEPKLFMMLLGCKPTGRHTEQHDVFFGIAPTIKDLIPDIKKFWPLDSDKKIHVDVWREVTYLQAINTSGEVIPTSGRIVTIVPKDIPRADDEIDEKLFFLNLGGYKPGEFDEAHYKMIISATNSGHATMIAKETAFYKHVGIQGSGGNSHIDDKYSIDVDDSYQIKDILPEHTKELYRIQIKRTVAFDVKEDVLHSGYMQLDKIK